MSEDALKPKIITDPDAPTPVPEEIQRTVDEGAAAGVLPIRAPQPSTPSNPRAHLPQYEGKMRGELPDNHPTVKRRVAEYKAMRRREKERDDAVRAIEATVPQKVQLGARVVIGTNAKVDYEDENGVRIKGDYGGIEGEVYQTYIDPEGTRRHIIIDRDPETGKSRYAPVAVRECDVTELGRREAGGRRFHAVPKSSAQRAQEAEAARRRHATMTPEETERAAFGGLTAKELADRMCGL